MQPSKKPETFLKHNGLHPDCYNIEAEVNKLISDMKAGLKDETGSTLMIPAFLSMGSPIMAGSSAIIVDAGGTNLRVGYVSLDENGIPAMDFQKYRIPGADHEIDSDEFFDAIAEKLIPYADKSDKIGFCFSFAAKCTEDHDGIIINFAKEVRVRNSSGLKICEELSKALLRKGITKKYSYVLLNDSVAALFGDLDVCRKTDEYSGYISAILGTGFNICYQENVENIGKLTFGAYNSPNMVINTEAGYYNGFKKGPIDTKIDNESGIPGDHYSEKLISGAYLWRVITYALKAFSDAGYFSEITSQRLYATGDIQMPAINDFIDNNEGTLYYTVENEADRALVRTVIESVYKRTARILTIFFSAMCELSGFNKDKPVCLIMDGSTYTKSPLIQKYLKEELEKTYSIYGRRFYISTPENPTIIGSACAALMNT